jgi:hypothetical protein
MLLNYSKFGIVKSHNKGIITIKEVTEKNYWSSFLTRPTGKPTPNYLSSLPSRSFEITGENPGPAYIEVADSSNGNTFVRLLEVSVKTERIVTIAFHFVEDIAGKTTRDPNIVNSLIRFLDHIYGFRTNISFQIKRAAPVQANVYLPELVRERRDVDAGSSRSQREWDKLVDTRDPGADFNVFFVPAVKPKKSNIPFRLMHTIGADCVCDDDRFLDTIIQILSHDIGVALGCDSTSDSKKQNHLMFESPLDRIDIRRTGDFISKDCVNIMNPSGL